LHSLTFTSNFTYGRALRTGNQVQASSSYTTLNPFDHGANYGSPLYDYKFPYDLNLYDEMPLSKGIRLLPSV
jgi:hypothetical protein